jgi:ribulose-5-phosphate 4-epimerase/fuculose-1-phosphate aldolase
MRGHGFAAAGATIQDVVRLSVYLPVNARVMSAAMSMGKFKPLAQGELESRGHFNPKAPESFRAWEYWARRAGVGHLLSTMP